MFDRIIAFIRNEYGGANAIPLHQPTFAGNEKQYLLDCIDSTFVSSSGAFIDRFEKMVCEFTGAGAAVATMNGTAALHLALHLEGVKNDDEVLTQPLTFVATCNAIRNCGAAPVFIDVDRDTLGMSAETLAAHLDDDAEIRDDGSCYSRASGRRLAACVPMHTFGHPARIELIARICRQWHIPLVEDAAESFGSSFKGRHTGLFGQIGTLSFNGNKTITTGGGGMIITDNVALGRQAKHLATTAKRAHPYEYVHDVVGFNYRLPNLNAALGCAQMEQLTRFLQLKRKLAGRYRDFFAELGVPFVEEPVGARSNFWLNAILLPDRENRDAFLQTAIAAGVCCRPVWQLMPELQMFAACRCGNDLANARWLADRVVNLPSWPFCAGKNVPS